MYNSNGNRPCKLCLLHVCIVINFAINQTFRNSISALPYFPVRMSYDRTRLVGCSHAAHSLTRDALANHILVCRSKAVNHRTTSSLRTQLNLQIAAASYDTCLQLSASPWPSCFALMQRVSGIMKMTASQPQAFVAVDRRGPLADLGPV